MVKKFFNFFSVSKGGKMLCYITHRRIIQVFTVPVVLGEGPMSVARANDVPWGLGWFNPPARDAGRFSSVQSGVK